MRSPLFLFLFVVLAAGTLVIAASSYKQKSRFTLFAALAEPDWNDLEQVRGSLQRCLRECSLHDKKISESFLASLPSSLPEGSFALVEGFALALKTSIASFEQEKIPLSKRIELLQLALGINSLLPSSGPGKAALLEAVRGEAERISSIPDPLPALYPIFFGLLKELGKGPEEILSKAKLCLARFPDFAPCLAEKEFLAKELSRAFCAGVNVRPRIRFYLAQKDREGSFRKSATFPDGEFFYETWPKLDRYHIARVFEAVPSSVQGLKEVTIEFTKEGARIFEEVSKSEDPKHLAIFLDDTPLIAPLLMAKGIKQRATITFDPAKPLPISLELKDLCRKIETPSTIAPE